MVTRDKLRTVLVGREVAIAYVVILSLYLLRHVRVRPIQIPAYLLGATYDLVELALPIITPYHPIGFPVYLYLLAAIGAGVVRFFNGDHGKPAGWIEAVGGVLVVVGVLSLLFGAVVDGPLVAAADNPTPLAILVSAAVVFIGGGWYLLRRGIGFA